MLVVAWVSWVGDITSQLRWLLLLVLVFIATVVGACHGSLLIKMVCYSLVCMLLYLGCLVYVLVAIWVPLCAGGNGWVALSCYS